MLGTSDRLTDRNTTVEQYETKIARKARCVRRTNVQKLDIRAVLDSITDRKHILHEGLVLSEDILQSGGSAVASKSDRNVCSMIQKRKGNGCHVK